ncbi:DUF1801 domain-containing protein [Mycobacterium sp. ITM-2016-00317]|jgi:hypothetical protein|uniref:DUF1801 domain-containing protein n=1 Tax=Mycobacterium sp. ITM-2016-00317 TaxID=2099694 RepID=UPI000D4FE390|nr:DUF1801 domain-containing protein [Mycobacterium sp. ITM-2016-00317]WNG85313.1 DUF1801 domain-containing protein [Mycobacterium sp. ITM-2016-00317]
MPQKTGDSAVTAKIAELPAYRDVAARLHKVITDAAPELRPRLWYGMPGYAKTDKGPVICFFRVDADDYVTFGLTEKASLSPDADAPHKLIGSAWFLTQLDPPTEARITEIVTRAAS